MSSVLRRALRVLLGLLIGLSFLFVVAFFCVRQPTWKRLRNDAPVYASEVRLRQDVLFFTTAVRPRSADRPENLERAADYIRRSFERAGARVSVETFKARGKTYRNVVADFGPQRCGRIVVGAHYDAFAATGDLPGADDNASGTAGLLELARLLGTHAPTRPVQVVAFTTEEPPFFGSDEMGSAVHAERLAKARVPVEGMICLEMIGYYRGQQTWPSPLFQAIYPSQGNFISVAGGWRDRALARTLKVAIRSADGIRVFSFTGPREMLDASDQRNYWSHGWPAVMVSDTAYLRNPNYHTKKDTADTLDYVKMARVVDGVYLFLIQPPRSG